MSVTPADQPVCPQPEMMELQLSWLRTLTRLAQADPRFLLLPEITPVFTKSRLDTVIKSKSIICAVSLALNAVNC